MSDNLEPIHGPADKGAERSVSDFEESETIADRPGRGSFLRRQLPYILILGLAIVGVAYTNIAHQPLVGYWEFLALATGLVCVIAEWPSLSDRQARVRLIWTQSVHWVAVLVAMNIMLLSGVQQLFPPATSLALLLLLALGTFLAGLNLSLLPMLLGSGARLGGPRCLFLALVAVFLVGLAVTLWPKRSDQQATKIGNAAGQRTSA